MRIFRKRALTALTTLAAVSGVLLVLVPRISANALITVNSDLDTVADDGLCTLREAITASNTNTASGATGGECAAGDAGADTIEFDISSTADFTISGQNGYTIDLASDSLPLITEEVLIDGYSQTGAQPNTAVSPAPLNGILLIEINGTNLDNVAPNQESCIELTAADNSRISGLVINRCGGDGILSFGNNFLTVSGNYIGTDPTGLLPLANGRDNTTICVGSGIQLGASNNATIGGTAAADRNIIAANQCDDLFIQNESDNANPSENNTIQGNYIGLGADGTTPLPAGWAPGLGNAILFGNSHDDLVGGTASGAMNVIATSNEFGISFRDGCSGTRIEGNYIGTDYTGNTTLTHTNGTGHINTAVHIFALSGSGMSASHDITVGGATTAHRNVISGNSNTFGGWEAGGVAIEDGAYNNIVQGNYIGVGADGNTALGNQGPGVEVYSGTTEVNMIGGANPGEGNTIANNGRAGVLVGRSTDDLTNRNAILGNSIYSNVELGIDLGNDGTTTNDDGDVDGGPNGLLNTPRYTSVVESNGDTTVGYVLDVPAGDYRVEFYSNTTADGSGNGEAEQYLGATTIAHSGVGNESFSFQLTGVTGVTNLAMTTTQIDQTTFSGFGSTSELGGTIPLVPDSKATKVLNNPDEVMAGGTVEYTLTFSNIGTGDMSLSAFNGLDSNPFLARMFMDFMPDDLIYVSSSNPDIECQDATGLLGSLLPNHPGYSAFWCTYSGVDMTLEPGESVSTVITATVKDDSDLVFDNAVLAGIVVEDPDTSDILDAGFAAFTSGGTLDLLDLFTASGINNLASAAYSPPVPETENSGLAKAGASVVGIAMFGGAIASGVVLANRRKQSLRL